MNENVIIKNVVLNYYNRIQKRLLLEKSLLEESKAVYSSSLEVLKEFEDIDNEVEQIFYVYS